MKALPIKLLICHLLFLFQGIDSLFFDYQKTLFKAIEAYVDHAWVLMTITMILTAVNALIVLTSLGYYWPRIFSIFQTLQEKMSEGNEHLYYVEKTLIWREINYQHPPIRLHNKPLLVKTEDDLFVDSYSKENGWGKVVDCRVVWVAVVNWP